MRPAANPAPAHSQCTRPAPCWRQAGGRCTLRAPAAAAAAVLQLLQRRGRPCSGHCSGHWQRHPQQRHPQQSAGPPCPPARSSAGGNSDPWLSPGGGTPPSRQPGLAGPSQAAQQQDQLPQSPSASQPCATDPQPAPPPAGAQQQQQGRQPSASPAAHAGSSSAAAADGAAQQQPQQPPPWPPDVPWGLGTLVRVLGLWLLAYVAMGQLVVPCVLVGLGIERPALSARGQALLNLAVDLGQVGVTVAMLRGCLGRYAPRARGLFRIAWDGGRWLVWVAAGVACFPVIDWLAAQSTALLLGSEGASAVDVVSAQVELGLYSRDWVTTGAYAAILALCAPLWEELMFRGFLLPSLAGALRSRRGAAAGSALVFALLHSQAETFAPLVLVGLAAGWLYLACNNLLPAMVYHGLWNLYVMASMALQMQQQQAGAGAGAAAAGGLLAAAAQGAGGGGRCGASLALGAAMAGAVLLAAAAAALPRWLGALRRPRVEVEVVVLLSEQQRDLEQQQREQPSAGGGGGGGGGSGGGSSGSSSS